MRNLFWNKKTVNTAKLTKKLMSEFQTYRFREFQEDCGKNTTLSNFT